MSKGEPTQDTTQPAEAGKQGNELDPQKGKPSQGTLPEAGEKATTSVPSTSGKEGSGDANLKTQYGQLQKAYDNLRTENESLRNKLVNMDISPLARAMDALKQGLESRSMEDQMWRIGQMAEGGDSEGANRLAERELNRQLAELGLKPETAPPQVMQGDAVQRLHNLLLIRPFLAQQRQLESPPQEVKPSQELPVQAADKIGGKTLEQLESEWAKKHGLLNISKQQPGGITDALEGCVDPAILLKAGVQRQYEED